MFAVQLPSPFGRRVKSNCILIRSFWNYLSLKQLLHTTLINFCY